MKITFVIGGARSGKSSFALEEASGVKGGKAYIATAQALDDEMRERVEKHKAERGNDWDTYEEQVSVSEILMNIQDKYNAILLDCLTMWLSNEMMRTVGSECRSQTVEERIDKFIADLKGIKDGIPKADFAPRLFVVSNEVGTGIVPENKLARQFRDLAGILNQKVAALADEVYLVTAGIPLKIKGSN